MMILRLSEKKWRARAVNTALKKLFPKAKIALHFSNPWELLVAVQLSAQCTDKKVNEITPMLFKKYRKLGDYVTANRAEFEKDIRPSGFYRNKTKNILAAAKIIQEQFRGKLPKTMEEMVTIPGVGRKSANVILGNAYGVVEGIAVDTHVIRLANALGLTTHRNDPIKIERDLMAILPKEEWFSFTYRLINYGRQHCPARKHRAADCPLKKFYKPDYVYHA
ncbi:MAG: endonuclease III [Patescibacteria group bacterium]